MSPDEFIAKVECQGIHLTRRTLLNYEKWGVITAPKRGGGGPGGFWTDFSQDSVDEFIAGWKLLHGRFGDDALEKMVGGIRPRISPESVKKIRETNYNLSSEMETGTAKLVKGLPENGTGRDIVKGQHELWNNLLEALRKELIVAHGPVYANFFVALMYAWSEEKFKSFVARRFPD